MSIYAPSLVLVSLTRVLMSWGEIQNPEYTLSIVGVPCDGVIDGAPGSYYDDGTFGEPYFTSSRPGRNLEVRLTKTNSPPGDFVFGQTYGWSWAVGVEGAALITDVSTIGTITCPGGTEPGCLGGGSFSIQTELTGEPWGKGPQTAENHGAACAVLMGTEGSILPGDGTWVIGRLRITTTFPEQVGDEIKARIVFAPRIGSGQIPVVTTVAFVAIPITEQEGNPPLHVSGCELTFVAVDPVERFVRCDANGDSHINLADSVWLLNELFQDGQHSTCPIARDCNHDGDVNLTDTIFLLLYLFSGGPEPLPPFPECGSVDGMTQEDCPGGSTRC
jgi:hypothetical protein